MRGAAALWAFALLAVWAGSVRADESVLEMVRAGRTLEDIPIDDLETLGALAIAKRDFEALAYVTVEIRERDEKDPRGPMLECTCVAGCAPQKSLPLLSATRPSPRLHLPSPSPWQAWASSRRRKS
jgi:hypothetical protein